MLKFHSVALAAFWIISPLLGLATPAEKLRFAWPDGATAKVTARSEGRRVADRTITWDMSSEFTMQVRRAGDRVRIERTGFNGWKGTLPPSFGGGAERFMDMIPTFIVSADGAFVGIEGHEAARKLMNSSVEQSGGLPAVERSAFENFSSNAALEAMARDHWSALVGMWEDVELDPEAEYEMSSVATVPQLGGGQIDIKGAIRFVKEAPCASGLAGRRCAYFSAETGADKAQISRIIESILKQAGAGGLQITDFDQRLKVEIVVEKATMLPQQLTFTRLHALGFRMDGRSYAASEEINKTYTFEWVVPSPAPKK